MTRARLAVGPGAGRLVRRAEGVLFVGGAPDLARWEPIIDAYLDAATGDDAREAVTAAAVAAGFDLDPFVMVAWPSAIELLVLGAIDVHTDLPSVPQLTGAPATTWVEHRVARPPAAARIEAGAGTATATRLDAGAIAAGGFALTLTFDAADRAPDPDPPAGRAFAPPTPGAARLAPAGQPGPPPAGGPRPLPAAVRPTRTAEATTTAARTERGATTGPVTGELPGLVRARRCGRGHPNPRHAAQCRTCGELIGAASTVEMIVQPVLGKVVLPDGSTIAVNGTAVLGRRPDTEAARVASTATIVPLAVDAGVSRTHLVIRADGWTMTATDCASRGRTVLRSPGSPEPEVLEPWVPHELGPGDTLYLGGPTHLQVVDA